MTTSVRLACLLLLLASFGACQEPDAVDLVVRGARVFTADSLQPDAEAFAVSGGMLTYVGTDSGATTFIGRDTRVVDARGRLITPGFHDTHVHLLQAAAEREWCYLDVPETLEATVASLMTCAEESRGPWLLANDLNPDVFPPGGPPRGFLDDIEGERPVWVSKAGGHEAYVNQVVLELASIDSSTPNPPNGTIVRDETGRPTGTLRGAATTMVENRLADIWPEPTPEDVQEWLVEELEVAARLGIASVQEIPGFGTDIASVYDRVLDPAAGLPRVRFAQRIFEYGEETGDAAARIEQAVDLADRMEARGIRADVIKLFVDGDFPPQTAALTEPYASPQEPGWRGAPYFSQADLNDVAARADAAGLQLHFHAIGDRAVRMSLDAIEFARSANGVRDARHQITHLHLTGSQDLHRFAELGVVANVQPIFADNHSYNTVLTRELLGLERNSQLHRFRDLLDAGADLVVSTDYPMILLEPLETIQTALTRQMPGSAEAAFNPEQRLSLDEVLRAYTLGGAYANFLDRESGSLEVGKSADFVMFDRDLFEVAPDSLIDVRVVWTVIRGREVYFEP